jgi:hypothetical protein
MSRYGFSQHLFANLGFGGKRSVSLASILLRFKTKYLVSFVRSQTRHSIAKTRNFTIELIGKNGCKGKRESRPTGLFEDANV